MFQSSALKIWFDYIKNRKLKYFIGAFAVLMTNLMQILAPKNIGWFVDFFTKKEIPKILTGHSSKQTFLNLFIVLVLSKIFINVFRFMWRITLGRQTHHACSMLRRDVWDHVRFFKKEDLQQKYTKGVLMNAEISDANSARFIFGFTLVAIFDLIFLGVFTFITMALIHPKMAIFSFLVLTFVPFFVQKLSKAEIDQYKVIQEVLSSFNDLSAQAIATIKLQRLSQTGKFWEKRLMDVASSHRRERLQGLNLSLKYIPLMGIASLISYLILFGLGIHFTFNNQMTIGEFISMQGLIFLLHDPLMTFGFVISEWRKAHTALSRLAAIYNHKKDETLLIGLNQVIPNEKVLEVENLSFSFLDGASTVISNLSFKLNANERLGITGPIGAGKSTLMAILVGLERRIEGTVNLFGNNFSHYSHAELRKYIGYVQQKPFLFADTVRSNVAMDLILTDEEVWNYLDIAGLKDDVLAFSEKLETQLGEWGINLSGGQKQRLTLARALARKPKLLFLDDCLSAVDTVTEERILKNLNTHLDQTTLVWVAHRKSTLKYCTQMLNLEVEGRL